MVIDFIISVILIFVNPIIGIAHLIWLLSNRKTAIAFRKYLFSKLQAVAMFGVEVLLVCVAAYLIWSVMGFFITACAILGWGIWRYIKQGKKNRYGLIMAMSVMVGWTAVPLVGIWLGIVAFMVITSIFCIIGTYKHIRRLTSRMI